MDFSARTEGVVQQVGHTHFCTCPGSFVSSLESSREKNQLAKVSCKTCGGRFLIDGIGPLSKNMLGTVGVEVTNSINPELSWKTVTKGKRSRKPAARSLNGRVGLGNKSPKRVGDFFGSDSDKFGETGTGQCFPDKVEYVPIKKRRHFLRSPSPSSRLSLYGGELVSPEMRTPSPHSDDLGHLSDHNGSSGSYTNRQGTMEVRIGNVVDDGVVGDKVSEVTGGEFYDSDNFSGIALLAAAACINNMDEDPCHDNGDVMEVSSAPQRSDTSISSLPVTESIPCSESDKQIHKDVSRLEIKGCSFVGEGSIAATRSSDETEECTAVKSVSSKVDRRHWDLNTCMDAWEQPNDEAPDQYDCFDTYTNGSAKLEKEGCATQKDSGSNGKDAESSLPLLQIGTIESSASKVKKNESEEFCCHDRSGIKETCLTNLKGRSMGPLSSADTTFSRHVLSSNESIDYLALSESCHSSEVSGGNVDSISSGMAVINGEDNCVNVMVSSLNTSEHNVALPEAAESERLGCQNDGQLKDAEDSQKISELPDIRTSLREEMCLATCRTVDVENSESTSEDNFHATSKGEGLSTSDVSVGGQSTVFCDSKGQDEKGLTADTLGTNAGVHSGSNEEAERRSFLQDLGKDFVLDECHNSDASQDECCRMDSRDDMTELQVGYDSPYEDGELRGSVLFSLEENEFEDGEYECLDYESDGRGGEDSDAGGYPGSKIVEAGSEVSQGLEKKRILAMQVQDTDCGKSCSVKGSWRRELENSEKIESFGKKVSNQGSGTTEELPTDVILERNDDSKRMRHTSDHGDALDVKGSYDGKGGSKSTRGKLQSHIEGPSSLDATERDSVYVQQSRGGAYSRAERDGNPNRFVTRYRSAVHERERNGGDGRSFYWDSRNRYPSSYRGPGGYGPTRQRSVIANSVDKFGANSHDHRQSIGYASRSEKYSTPDRIATRYRSAVHERERLGGDSHFVYLESRNRYPSSYRGPESLLGPARPRSAIAESVDKFGAVNSHDNEQPISYSSKNMPRLLGWRRSPVDTDDYHGGQRKIAGFSCNRNRGGSRNFSEGVGRGLREEYCQPVNDDAASSVRMPHYMSWKERNFFPRATRGAHVPLPRRTSRSRSRSPHAWQLQRERNPGAGCHSRSPDFRSEARMERMRAPYQKVDFAADSGEILISPTRGRFSPQRNYGAVDDRNFVDNHLRHRRSSLNVFRQNQRLDSLGLSGRLKPDDSFRPMTRAGRYPPMGAGLRECQLEDNIDDKRHDDRSGMMH